MPASILNLPVGSRTWWSDFGFAEAPHKRNAPVDGLLVYRAWGGSSSEWGSGFFSLEKPASVMDAELRFNIADWGNTIHFVSTFRIVSGVPYWVGPIGHGPTDLSRSGTQILLNKQDLVNVRMVKHAELLCHDGFVVARSKRSEQLWS